MGRFIVIQAIMSNRRLTFACIASVAIVILLWPVLTGWLLLWASATGRSGTVNVALKLGADINYKNFRGITPLMDAATNGHKETLQLLVSSGAHIDARMFDGRTALSKAAQAGQTECVKELLLSGADVNAGGRGEGSTPLMEAAMVGETECVEVLLQHDVRINATDIDGNNALIWACKSIHAGKPEAGQARIVDLLLRYGGDYLHKNQKGESAISLIKESKSKLLQDIFTKAVSGRAIQ